MQVSSLPLLRLDDNEHNTADTLDGLILPSLCCQDCTSCSMDDRSQSSFEFVGEQASLEL